MSKHSALEKASFVAFGIVLLGASWFSGCNNKKPIAPVSPTQDIKQLGTEIKNTGRDLRTTTDVIRINATDGMNATPVPVQPILNPFWTNILTATGVQDQLVKNLTAMTVKADEAEKKAVKFEKDFTAEAAARKKAEDSVTKELRQKYMAYSGILFFISLICGGIAIFSRGSKLALYGGLLAGAGSAACIFIVQSVALIPWIVGGMALIGLALLVWTLFFKDKKGVKLENATKELVETLEAAKPRMTMAGRAKMFGDGPGKGDAFAIQSKETEALVKEIRKDIENAPKLPPSVATDWNGDGVIDDLDCAPVTAFAPVELVSPQRPLAAAARKKVLS